MIFNMLPLIQHTLFKTPQMPYWEAFQYMWACLLIGNARSFLEVPIKFMETFLIAVTPYWLNIFVLRYPNAFELYDHSLLLFILIFAVMQCFPMKIITPLNMPYLIFAHSVNVIRRFIFCHSKIIDMHIAYSLPATLFISSSDSIFCFAIFKLIHHTFSKYCGRRAFLRSVSGCVVYFVSNKLGYISEPNNALIAVVFITIYDYCSIFYRSWMEMHERMRQREACSD